MRSVLLIVTLLLLMGGSVCADDVNSGNHYLPACKALNENKPASSVEAFNEGTCAGVIRALMDVGPELSANNRFCLPTEATLGQSGRVIVSFLESKPQELNKSFVSLAIQALRAAWPCK